MSETKDGPKKARNVDFTDSTRTRVSARDFEGNLEYGDWEQLTPDVRVRTWKFEDVDPAEKDGALVQIITSEETKAEKKVGHTPVQLVESDTTFNEVPLTNRLIFLSMNPDNEIAAYLYDSSKMEDRSFMFEVGKGTVMCWFTLETDEPAEFLEYEDPGFGASKLTDVEPDSKKVGDRNIPDNFWVMFHQLESGQIENNAIPIYDISSETL